MQLGGCFGGKKVGIEKREAGANTYRLGKDCHTKVGQNRETSAEVLRERGAAYSLRLAERQRMGSRMSD